MLPTQSFAQLSCALAGGGTDLDSARVLQGSLYGLFRKVSAIEREPRTGMSNLQPMGWILPIDPCHVAHGIIEGIRIGEWSKQGCGLLVKSGEHSSSSNRL